MCLQRHYKKKPPHNLKTVYKVVVIENNGISTPYKLKKVKGGWFKAEGTISKTRIIAGGVIHCYTTLERAKKCCQYASYFFPRYIMKVRVNVGDFISYGKSEDIAFKKIFIPKSEITKVLKKYKAEFV